MRGPEPVRREAFKGAVEESVVDLARKLNRVRVTDLRRMGVMNRAEYNGTISSIEKNIERISRTKHTVEVQPELGSKVLHHFFPSVIPAYDQKMVSKRALRIRRFRTFLEAEPNPWVSRAWRPQSALEEYDYYLGFCAQQISDTQTSTLSELRNTLAHVFADLAPRVLYEKRRSLLWRLDAKLAEYCIIGASYA